MSKQLNRKQVQNLITNYRKMGYKDYEILGILEKSDNAVGKYYQDVVNAGFKDDFVKDYGLDPKVPFADKAKSMAESGFVGAGKAFSGVVQGVAWLGDKVNEQINDTFGTNLSTTAYKDYTKSVDDVIAQKDQRREDVGRKGIDVVETVSNIGFSLPKYFLGGGAGAGAKLTTKMAEQGLRGAVDGATQHASSAKERAVNTALGGVFGAGGEALGAGLRYGAGKTYNAVKGNKTAHHQAMDDLGQKYGVQLTAGDIGRNAGVKQGEVQLERLPIVGMQEYRQTQQNQAKQAVLNIKEQFEKNLDATDFKAIEKLRAKASGGDIKAKRVLEKANNATTPEQVMQASLEIKDWRMKEIAKSKYDLVQKELDKLPSSQDKTVATTQTMAKLAEGERIIKTSLAPDDTMAREIKKFIDNLNDPNRPKDYKNMRLLRSQIGDMAYKYDGLADPNPTVSNYLKDLRTAVEQDISNFAVTSGNPAIKTAYQKADKFYHAMKKQQDKDHAKAMKTSTPDQIYQTFVKKGQGDKAENFYNALDVKGQSAVRYKMIDEAIAKSYDEGLGENGVFSPAKFAAEFDRLAKPYERVFKGADKAEMDGFLKLMSHIERAGQYAENPPTGIRLGDALIVGGALTNPIGTVKGVAVSMLAKTLFTSKAGKNLLLSASELPVGASGLDNILKTAQKMSGVGGANLAVQTAGNLQDPPTEPSDEYQAMPDDERLANNSQPNAPQETPLQNQWKNPFKQGGQTPQIDFTAPQISDYLPSDFGGFGQSGQPMGEPQGETAGNFDPVATIGNGLASLIPPPQNPDNMGDYEQYVQSAVGRIMQTPQMSFILDQVQSDNPDFARIEKAQMSLSHTPEWKNFVKSLPDDVKQKIDGANILALLTNNQIHGNNALFNPVF